MFFKKELTSPFFLSFLDYFDKQTPINLFY